MCLGYGVFVTNSADLACYRDVAVTLLYNNRFSHVAPQNSETALKVIRPCRSVERMKLRSLDVPQEQAL